MILGFNIGFLEVDFVDLLDIALVSILLYQVYKLMRGSVAVKIFLGFLSLYLLYLVVNALEMELLSNILGQFMGVGFLAAIILFQQEIRKFLFMIGRTTIFNRENIFKGLPWRKNSRAADLNITPIIEAAKSLGATNTGALIVISKSSELKFYAESGDRIDAVISKRLLLSIFNKYSPLHDGAVIIYNRRIEAARCILPVTERDNLPAQFGLRHRAAIGMSEATDTLILVVSEETGKISTVRNGMIHHNLSAQELRSKINAYLYEQEEEEEETPLKKKRKGPRTADEAASAPSQP
ncbi:diadenylate cyclase CdaA [Cesiribacter andamanensis]|uniref:Diadenylate cyclase n=1 Tax=Cesiribacter andamanensis AMV16 TaxID=1279009 RepID=M7P1N9_9BACT|nr:diadenylate cyclase CdaA [Cesiribacter andamanensis]EMR04524.1 DNA integrity scanning protein DisA [Cesiribacter andamanensis AMV16]